MEGIEETLRKRVLKILEERDEPVTVNDIMRELGLKPSYRKLVYESISHLAKSIRRMSKGRKVLVMRSPYCLNCGYVFKNLKRVRKPSKCPRCKSERIMPPAFLIMEIKDIA